MKNFVFFALFFVIALGAIFAHQNETQVSNHKQPPSVRIAKLAEAFQTPDFMTFEKAFKNFTPSDVQKNFLDDYKGMRSQGYSREADFYLLYAAEFGASPSDILKVSAQVLETESKNTQASSSTQTELPFSMLASLRAVFLSHQNDSAKALEFAKLAIAKHAGLQLAQRQIYFEFKSFFPMQSDGVAELLQRRPASGP